MFRRLPSVALALVAALAALPVVGHGQAPRRNVLIFVADGLRHGSINATDTPALWAVRTEGVHFSNSHSMVPTLTMVNASAIASGHMPGDTGIFGNVIDPGFAVFDTGNFGLLTGTPLPFLENNRVLADLDSHFGGSVLPFDTFLAAARAHGYRTASLGKLGPTAMQDVASIAPSSLRQFPVELPGLIVDDGTGNGEGVPLPADLAVKMLAAGFPNAAPGRTNGYDATSPYNNGYSGTYNRQGTLAANTVQQDWFLKLATQWVLPRLTTDAAKPFALLFWSRDPDATQHNTGDGLGRLYPGINGPTSVAAVRNADRMLQGLMAWLDAHPDVKANTDVFVTSDHGFATISRTEIDRRGTPTAAESARHDYLGAAGGLDTIHGTLPPGFLALDLAYDLGMDVFDPDVHPAGSRLFRRLRIGSAANPVRVDTWEHPVSGDALLGPTRQEPDGSDARVIVAANGGSDLIYIPNGDADMLARVVARVLTYDYVGGVFVDTTKYGQIAGTLPMNAINVSGSAKTPRPAAIVAMKVFYLNPDDLQTGIQISDTTFQEGQGMHGGFGRESTFNNMAAIGPDFKRGFDDVSPAGNADLTPTLLHVIGADMTRASLAGRVLSEALLDGPAARAASPKVLRSASANGRQTVLVYQEHGGVRYIDRACLAAADVPDSDVCR